MMENKVTHKIFLETPLGYLAIGGSKNSISEIIFSPQSEEDTPTSSPALERAKEQLQQYFNGERTTFDLPLAPNGTNFQQKVWCELEKIPFGKTLSYAQLSLELENPLAIRAVAAANGKNKLMIVTPCHRVIGSDGSLTGYAGDLWRKKWLLEHEQATKQTKLF